MNDTYYGCYRTRTFADIFPDEDTFAELYNTGKIPQKLSSDDTIKTIYYLLYARYGNSHIAYSDEHQFKYAVLSTIFMYGPTWEKRLDVQEKLRGLSDDELRLGSKAIYNHAFNPSTAPSTSTLEELPTINDQNTSQFRRSLLQGYDALLTVLKTDVTLEFIDRFKRLFLLVVAPDYPLLYVTEDEE